MHTEGKSFDTDQKDRRPFQSTAYSKLWVPAALAAVILVGVIVVFIATNDLKTSDKQGALDFVSSANQAIEDLPAGGSVADPQGVLGDLSSQYQRRADVYVARNDTDLQPPQPPDELLPTGAQLLTDQSDFIDVVLESAGYIWADGSGYLARFDPASGEVKVWDMRDDQTFEQIDGLAPTREGGVWLILEDNSLRLFDGERFRDVVQAPPTAAGFKGDIDAVVETTHGTLFASSEDSGLFHWDGRTWSRLEDERPVTGANVLAVSADGYFWVGNVEFLEQPGEDEDPYFVDRGLSRYDGQRWATFTSDDAALLSDGVGNVVPLEDGAAWVGTTGGAAYFDGQSWHSFEAAEMGFGKDDSVSLSVGPDGIVWAATGTEPEGDVLVAIFDGEAWYSDTVVDLPVTNTNIFLFATPLATENGVFIATAVGLYQMVGDRWTKILPPREPAASAEAPIISDIPLAGVKGLETSGGFLWAWGEDEIWRYMDSEWSPYASAPRSLIEDVAYHNDTLWSVSDFTLQYLEGDEWQELPWPNSVMEGIEADEKSGTLWVSSGGELYRWKGKDMTRIGWRPNLSAVGEIAVSGDGTVWSGGGIEALPELEGLARYDDAMGSWEMARPWRADDEVLVLAYTPSGGLWAVLTDWSEDWEELLATGEWVLAHHDDDNGEWTIYEEGLPEGLPGAMAADDEYVWLAGGGIYWFINGPVDGLIRFDGQTWTHYLPETDVIDVALAPDGTVWYLSGDDSILHQLR